MNFSGKAVVVTGAASGMGRATAIGFGAAGANVALVDINVDGAQEVANQIGAAGAEATVYGVDISEPAAMSETLETVYERYGRLDAVANVAAIFPQSKVLDTTEEFWDRVLSIDLRGVFFCCQTALRIMVPQGHGAIVNVSSGAAFRPVPGHVVYSAAKAGLVGMSRVLALEFARTGVRVNVLAPDHTLSATTRTRLTEDEIDAIAATLVPGRWMTPEEQANAIMWLCSDEASGVNGAILNVNGGIVMP
jgi:NAD(P)-dependent dehydrogenase (short-subunit alcohol dehydrogenase family)